MKILLANKYFYPRGGDCVHTIGLKRLLEENGHKVAVFSMQHSKNLKTPYDNFWPSNVEYGEFSTKNILKNISRPIYSHEVKQKWTTLLKEFNPDVVHLHNIHTQLSPLIAKLAYNQGIPVYWTLHDYKLICPAYTFFRNGEICEKCISNKLNVIKHKCIKNNLFASLLGYMEAITWSIKPLEQYTTKFICPSVFLKNKMHFAGFDQNKLVHLYNFIDAERILPLKDRDNYIVYIGRLSYEKGIETLLEIVKTNASYRIKIIGDGPMRKDLQTKYNSQHIEFLGHQDWEYIKTTLRKARFMVIPSEWYENNPLTIIEALTMGTPVLGSNIGGIPELIKPNVNGLLFKAGDKMDLRIRLEEMINFGDWDYNQISLSAIDKYSRQEYYQQLLSIYANSK